MKTRAEYELALQVVRKVLSDWDPYLLIANGSPADEFDDEAARVVVKIDDICSAHDAAEVISRVFGASFGEEGFAMPQCLGVGVALHAALARAGLIVPCLSPQRTATPPLK